MVYDMTKLTDASTAAASVSSESNVTIRVDADAGVREMAAGSVLPVASIVIPTALLAQIFARGIATEKGKELKATVTIPRGSLQTATDGKYYEGMRLGMNAFARKV